MKTSEQRQRRSRRVRAKVAGSETRPRLSVFRSNKHISAQLVDDEKGVTLAFASDKGLEGTGTETALAVGRKVADLAKEKKIERAVFDRGAYRYHGRVKAVAEGAREQGLKI